MADDSEVIGGVKISVEGDFSSLDSDFAAAVQKAQDEGATLAAALQDAVKAPDVGPLNDALSSIGAGASDQLDALQGALAGVASGASEAAAVAATAATSMGEIGTAAETAAGGADDLASRIQALVDSGMTLAEALAADSASMAALSSDGAAAAGAFETVGGAANVAAEQLSLFDAAVQIPFADAAGQLNLFATELEPIAGAAQTAAQAVEELGRSVEDTGASIGGISFSAFSDGAQSIITAQQEADAEFERAKGALDEIQAAYDLGAVSAQTLARAEEEVGSAFAAANPGVQEAGEHAHEAAGGFGELGEKLLGLGEALAITEGLHELGMEALEASDNITRASIALTVITGDAEEAEATIGKLEALGKSDGLAMPSLLQAGTRLQQLLGPEADVASLLSKIADGAAVMGTSIDAAATKFATLANQGTASARSMSSLGLNLTQLAAALNEVNPALDATAATAAKAFKALDPEDRITVLTTALEGLGGVAQKVAEQTFGGQWQTLANQWEGIMVEVGNALLPVISELTDFAKVDILPAVKAITEAFNSLDPTVKELVVTLGLLLAAAAPIAVALGGIGIAMEGLAGLSAAVAEAFGGLAELFSGAGLAAGGLATTLGLVGAAVAAAIILIVDFKSRFQELSDAAAASDKSFQGWLSTQVQAALATKDATTEAQALEVAQNNVNKALENGLITTKQAAEYTTMLADAQKKLVGSGWAEYAAAAGISIKILADNTKAAGDGLTYAAAQAEATSISMGKLRDAVDSAKQKLIEAVAAFDGSAKSAEAVAKAQDAVSAATRQLSQNLGEVTPKFQQLTIATHEFVDTSLLMVTAQQALADIADATEVKFDTLATSLKNAQVNLAFWLAQLDQAKASGADFTGILAQVAKALALVESAQKNLNTALDAMRPIIAGITPLLQGIVTPATVAGFTALEGKLKDLLGGFAQAPALISPLNQAVINLGGEAGKTGTSIGQLKSGLDSAIGSVGQFVAGFNNGAVSFETFEKGIGNIDKAIAQLAKTDLPAAVAAQAQFVSALEQAGAPLTVIQTQFSAYQSLINKLAQTDLPAAIAAQQQFINQLQHDLPGAYEAIVKAQQDELNMEITLAERTGADANTQVLALEKIKLAHEANALAAHGYADAAIAAINDVLKGFDQLGSAMADAIVNGKNLGDALVNEFKKIGQSVLGDVINLALVPLKKDLVELIESLLPKHVAAIAASTAGTTALGAASTVAATAEGVQATAAGVATAAVTAFGIASALAAIATYTLVGAIAAAIGAIAGIAGDVILSHISSDTGHIEVNTRAALAELMNARKDAWDQHDGLISKLDAIQGVMQAVYDTLAAKSSGDGSSGIGDGPTSDLDNIAQNMASLLTATVQADNLLGSILGLMNTVVFDANAIARDTDAISGKIDSLIGRVDAITSAILNVLVPAIHEQQRTSASQSQMMAQMYTAQLGTMSAVKDFQGTYTSDASKSLAEQIDDARRALDVALQTARAAQNTADQIAALKQAQSVDAELARLATLQGSTTLAAQYASAADALGTQITALGQTVDATGQVISTATMNGANAVSFAAMNAGTVVSNAVTNSASFIASSVSNAFAASTAALGTFVASLVSSTTRAGVSDSASGGGSASAPVTGPGSSTYTPPPSTPPPDAPPYVPPPGTGGFHPTGPPKGFTGYSGAADVPSYDLGGFNDADQLAMLHAGEWIIPPAPATIALPPDVLARAVSVHGMDDVRAMAQVPQSPAIAGTPEGAAQGNSVNQAFTFNVYAGNPRETVQAISDYMKRVSPRMAVASS